MKKKKKEQNLFYNLSSGEVRENLWISRQQAIYILPVVFSVAQAFVRKDLNEQKIAEEHE